MNTYRTDQSNAARLEFLCIFLFLSPYLTWLNSRTIQTDPPKLKFIKMYKLFLPSLLKTCLKPLFKKIGQSFVSCFFVRQPYNKSLFSVKGVGISGFLLHGGQRAHLSAPITISLIFLRGSSLVSPFLGIFNNSFQNFILNLQGYTQKGLWAVQISWCSKIPLSCSDLEFGLEQNFRLKIVFPQEIQETDPLPSWL